MEEAAVGDETTVNMLVKTSVEKQEAFITIKKLQKVYMVKRLQRKHQNY